MAATADYLDEVGEIAGELNDLGLGPVLVGGMALVMMGSQRVTRDFDFVIGQPGARLDRLIDVLYDRGLELASRLNAHGEVTATIRSRAGAVVRLRLDAPASAYFYNPQTGLRIDLLFDFPIPATTLRTSATRRKVRSHVFHVASEPDLLRLKKIAKAARSLAADEMDIAFLEARRKGSDR